MNEVIMQKANEVIKNLEKQYRDFVIAMTLAIRFQGRLSIEQVLGFLDNNGVDPVFHHKYADDAIKHMNDLEDLIKNNENSEFKSIVINDSFGEFGISNKALLELIKIESEIVKVTPILDIKEARKEFIETFSEDYVSHKFVDGCLCKHSDVYCLVSNYSEEVRSHPDLIKIVEKLGKKSFGAYASLKVVQIPTDTEYTIEVSGGRETVRERSKMWR